MSLLKTRNTHTHTDTHDKKVVDQKSRRLSVNDTADTADRQAYAVRTASQAGKELENMANTHTHSHTCRHTHMKLLQRAEGSLRVSRHIHVLLTLKRAGT